jgi:hypothetical protein
VAKFTRDIKIDFETHEGVDEWLKENDLTAGNTTDLKVAVEVYVRIEEFEEAEIVRAFVDIVSNGIWLERVYRLLAEDDTKAAMEEMHAQFPMLAPPSTECAIADLLSGNRGSVRG